MHVRHILSDYLHRAMAQGEYDKLKAALFLAASRPAKASWPSGLH